MDELINLKKEIDKNVEEIMQKGYKPSKHDIQIVVRGKTFTLGYNDDLHVGFETIIDDQIKMG